MLRLLHTADWHLGRRFPSFPEEGQKKLSRARMDVIARILDVARRNAVNAVLCVGDIFDDPEPAPDFWDGLAKTFRNHPGQHPPLGRTRRERPVGVPAVSVLESRQRGSAPPHDRFPQAGWTGRRRAISG